MSLETQIKSLTYSITAVNKRTSVFFHGTISETSSPNKLIVNSIRILVKNPLFAVHCDYCAQLSGKTPAEVQSIFYMIYVSFQSYDLRSEH